MRRLIILLLLTLICSTYVNAQETATTDYAIRNIQPVRFFDNEVIIQFDVVNLGSPLDAQTTVLLLTDTGAEIARQNVPPLGEAQSEMVSFSFLRDRFPAGSTQSLQITLAGLDEAEPNIPEARDNNFGRVSVTIPSGSGAQTQAPGEPGSNPLDILGGQIDLSDPVYIAVIAGICIAGLFLLVIIFSILRLIFRVKPTFNAWQPPYAITPYLDPSTTPGRRQGWQQYAQNDLLPPPVTAEGATHVRKSLMSLDGISFANWQVTAMRLTQYDQYGRVTRSQLIASNRVIRRLNGVIKKVPSLTAEQTTNRLRPIAGTLAKQFVKGMNPRSAMLPIALDIRLKGTHGEVRIVFELYYVQGGQWRKIDEWQPEMTLIDKSIDENLTYTLYGLRSGEVFKSFPQRLQDDIVHLLLDSLKRGSIQKAPTPPSGIDQVPS